eukprot:4733714-Amphidinium_carterae.2
MAAVCNPCAAALRETLVYGLQEASHRCQDHWGRVLKKEGWVRGIANPACMHHGAQGEGAQVGWGPIDRPPRMVPRWRAPQKLNKVIRAVPETQSMEIEADQCHVTMVL